MPKKAASSILQTDPVGNREIKATCSRGASQGGYMMYHHGKSAGLLSGLSKKLLFLSFVFAVLMGLSAGTPVAEAATDSAYITLRCTATVSVELFSGGLYNAATYYNFGDVSAASTYTATHPIGVRNNSQGAITRWDLDVTGISNDPAGGEWSLGNTPGLNRAVLYAKFSTRTLSSTDFDVANDTVTTTAQGAKRYELNAVSGNKFYDQIAAYVEPTFTTDCSRVLPSSYDPSPNGKAERHLWLKILTPTAIENANAQTTITLRITAY